MQRMADAAPGLLVSCGLLDGQVRVGRLTNFGLNVANLLLEPATPGGSKSVIAAEQIAYIGYHRLPGEPPPVAAPHAQRYKIHTAGGKLFRVLIDSSAETYPVGFMAVATAENPEFKALFFYKHAVNAREKDVPIGEMLVGGGAVAPGQIAQAVGYQQVQRSVPIGEILVEQRKVSSNAIAEAAALQQRKRMRIGEVLIEAGLATADDISNALQEQKKRRGKRLGEVLVELGIISEVVLAQTLAKKFEIAFLDLDSCVINPKAPDEVPRDVIQKYGVLPVDSDARALTVAMSDPLALDALDVLRMHVKGRRLDEVLVTASQLKRYVDQYLDKAVPAPSRQGEIENLLKAMASQAPAVVEIQEEEEDAPEEKPGDGNVVNLVNFLIMEGFRRGASDIHIEPNGPEAPTKVRFRVDGDCVASHDIPAPYRNSVVARIKIMSKLDIAERRKPQDGKIRFKMPDRQIELRVATLPTVNDNEDVVMRILANSKPLPLDKMGLSDRNLRELRRLMGQPYGLVLCVGPTGSGKTTTLHSALGYINTVDTKIWTAEDPVEITQAGLRQVQVNARIGFTFAHAMRAFLRADPDVIMVGEMRDHETASTGVEASLTGHLVLSTLHTNTAPETVTRLLDMGLDPFSFGDALLGVLAQRLARTLCGRCKQAEPASAEEYDKLVAGYGAELFQNDGLPAHHSELTIYRPRGCDACGNSGYKGRIGLHELLVSDDAIKLAIAQKRPVDEIRRLAIAGGMRTLLQDGIAKVVAGATDMKQVLAVCSR